MQDRVIRLGVAKPLLSGRLFKLRERVESLKQDNKMPISASRGKMFTLRPALATATDELIA